MKKPLTQEELRLLQELQKRAMDSFPESAQPKYSHAVWIEVREREGVLEPVIHDMTSFSGGCGEGFMNGTRTDSSIY